MFSCASVRYDRKVPPRLMLDLLYDGSSREVLLGFRFSSSSIAGVDCSIAFDERDSMKIGGKVKRIACKLSER